MGIATVYGAAIGTLAVAFYTDMSTNADIRVNCSTVVNISLSTYVADYIVPESVDRTIGFALVCRQYPISLDQGSCPRMVSA